MQQSLKTQTDSTRYFRVGLVEKAAVPQGAEGDNWCRYVLESELHSFPTRRSSDLDRKSVV